MANMKARLRALLSIAALGVTGCGSDASSPEEEIGTSAQAIGGVWRAFIQRPNQPGGFTGGAAVCNAFNTMGAFLTIGRATDTNRFRMSLQEHFPPTPWTDMGTQTFNSKAACAVLDDLYQAPPHCWKKVVVGRSASSTTLNRYLIRTVRVLPGVPDPETNNPAPSSPELLTNWNSIGTATWTSAPAAAAGGDALTVCGMRSDNRTWCMASLFDPEDSDFPYTGVWMTAVQAPPLPSPFTQTGDPAIANTEPVLGKMTVAVRGLRTSFPSPQSRLFWIQFDPNTNAFTTWTQFPTGALAINSDPAMDFDSDTSLATLYFRVAGPSLSQNHKIYEASGIGTSGWAPFSAINALGNTNSFVSGPPAAAGSLDGWEGEHVIIVPKSGQFYDSAPCPNGTC